MIQTSESLPARSRPEEIREMFDTIAPTYDFLNHFLSGGMDILWRKKAIRLLREKQNGVILDIATGSGDLAFDAMRLNPVMIVATDFSFNMLKEFHSKIERRRIASRPLLVSCDAMALPFAGATFDATMVAFGIRNFADRQEALKEMVRVLKPGGLSLILELTTPTLPIVKQAYGFYGTRILPLLGKLISQHRAAYTYLPTSISNFPSTEEFAALMKHAGFATVMSYRLAFGIATIFLGRKATV